MPVKRIYRQVSTGSSRSRSSSRETSRRRVVRRPYRLLSTTALRRNVSARPIQSIFAMEASIDLNNTTGWNSLGQSLTFSFNMNQVNFAIGAGLPAGFGFAYANATNYAALYDQYRILKVWVDIYYAENNSSLNSPAISLPIIIGVLDENDQTALTSAQIALGYGSARSLQLGNSSGPNNGRQTMVLNRPTVMMASGTSSTTVLSTMSKSPWIDTDFPTVAHNGMKFWYEPVFSNATDIGRVTFVFRQLVEFKNNR